MAFSEDHRALSGQPTHASTAKPSEDYCWKIAPATVASITEMLLCARPVSDAPGSLWNAFFVAGDDEYLPLLSAPTDEHCARDFASRLRDGMASDLRRIATDKERGEVAEAFSSSLIWILRNMPTSDPFTSWNCMLMVGKMPHIIYLPLVTINITDDPKAKKIKQARERLQERIREAVRRHFG